MITNSRLRAPAPCPWMSGLLALATCLAPLAGCGDGTGTLIVMLSGETNIRDGLEPGDELEHVRDGWRVHFDKWIATVGDFEASQGDSGHSHGAGDELHDSTLHVIDLTELPQSGLPIMRFEDVDAVRWRHVSYATGIATADAVRHSSVSRSDFDELVAAEATFRLAGHIQKAEQTIHFDFSIPAETMYSECRPEQGAAGFSVTRGGTTSIALTLHGDHLFFDSFATGSEGSIRRRAEWLVRADLDDDGMVTREELESIGPAQLGSIFPSSEYDLGGGGEILGEPEGIETAWDFVVAQMLTVGHFQGEGHCKFGDLDDDHDHDH